MQSSLELTVYNIKLHNIYTQSWPWLPRVTGFYAGLLLPGVLQGSDAAGLGAAAAAWLP